MFAIVDIETTGGHPKRSRITEIAAYLHNGKKVVNEFQTLVNPQQDIPANIQRLTGIRNEMVEKAPIFSEIAQAFDEFTKDCVFVAHNVSFDYGFITSEFAKLGMDYRRRRLCTVRLSRKILPGKLSYSLGSLCESEGISIQNRHRAAGDAFATSTLFSLLIERDHSDFITTALNPLSLEALMPPNLLKSDFLALPEKQGVYYFLNQKKEIIYVGKAKNIKKRIHSHFTTNSDSHSKRGLMNSIYAVDYQLVENNLLIELIEATEIKKHWPRYNRSMKRFSLNYGLFMFEDRNGYGRLSIGRCGKHDKPIKSYRTLNELKAELKSIIIDYELCPRLAGLQPLSSGACNYVEELSCNGACEKKEAPEMYNKRLKKAIEEYILNESTFVVKEVSKDQNNQAIVLVEKGRYKGYTTLSMDADLNDLEQLKKELHTAYDDQDLSYLLQSYLKNASLENIIVFNTQLA